MTSDTELIEAAAGEDDSARESLRVLIASARYVLFDLDGPVCRLFAGRSAERVATQLVAWLEERGLRGLLTEAERASVDPQVVLRAVDRRHPVGDLVDELERLVTDEELRAVPLAMPTPYADPLIRTWTAVGSRLAVVTNNSPLVVREYLASRGLTSCFTPHIYGRTREPRHLKPHPHCLHRALTAMEAAPSSALVIGDTPSDLLAAREAGVPFLGYARNEHKETPLRDAGAEVVVSSLETVLKVVRGQI